jgi:hypothetical protein
LHEQLAPVRHEQDSHAAIRALGSHAVRIQGSQQRLSEACRHHDQGAGSPLLTRRCQRLEGLLLECVGSRRGRHRLLFLVTGRKRAHLRAHPLRILPDPFERKWDRELPRSLERVDEVPITIRVLGPVDA